MAPVCGSAGLSVAPDVLEAQIGLSGASGIDAQEDCVLVSVVGVALDLHRIVLRIYDRSGSQQQVRMGRVGEGMEIDDTLKDRGANTATFQIMRASRNH